jgi:hypothetical protein
MSASVKGAKAACTRLYNKIITESSKFPQVNYREYFGRLAAEQKAALKNVDDPIKLREVKEKATAELEQMKRMVSVNRLYVRNPSILDVKETKIARKSSK